MINYWIAASSQLVAEVQARRAEGDAYTGPLTEQLWRTIKRVYRTDGAVVRGMFNTPTIGGKTYHMISIYLEDGTDALARLTAEWPSHFIVIGAWLLDGRQLGTEWELDVDGNRTGNTTGTPTFPVHAHAWRLMPDRVTYDPVTGDEVSRTPATSNADLRDINVLAGQAPRRFT